MDFIVRHLSFFVIQADGADNAAKNLISDERSHISHVEMAISARNMKSIQLLRTRGFISL